MYTLDNLADWVLKNRRGKAFRNYSKELIVAELAMAKDQNCLVIDVDSDGNIIGIIVACNLLYIKQILTTKQGSLKRLCSILRAYFPSIPWAATRNGMPKVYIDVNPMINKQLTILEERN